MRRGKIEESFFSNDKKYVNHLQSESYKDTADMIEQDEENTKLDTDMIGQDGDKVVGSHIKCFNKHGRDFIINDNLWKCELEINI